MAFDPSEFEVVGGFDPSEFEAIEPRTKLEAVKDTAIDFGKGIVGYGQNLVGVADIFTGNAAGKGLSYLGYDPKKTNEILSSGYSPARQVANEQVASASGFFDTLGALVDKPSVAFGTIIESAPMSLAGVAAARFAAVRMLQAAKIEAGTAAATKFFADPKVQSALIRVGAAAEGAQTAGGIQETGRQEGREWKDTVAPALAGGAGTAAIGVVSSKIPGFRDAEATVATAGLGARRLGGSLLASGKEIAKSMFKEGWLEELPQSMQEQIFTNLALDKPWDEGVGAAGAMGAVAGMGQGGGMTAVSEVANGLTRVQPSPTTPTTPAEVQQEPVVEQSPVEPLNVSEPPAQDLGPAFPPQEKPKGPLATIASNIIARQPAEVIDAETLYGQYEPELPGAIPADVAEAGPAGIDPLTGEINELLAPDDRQVSMPGRPYRSEVFKKEDKAKRSLTNRLTAGVIPKGKEYEVRPVAGGFQIHEAGEKASQADISFQEVLQGLEGVIPRESQRPKDDSQESEDAAWEKTVAATKGGLFSQAWFRPEEIAGFDAQHGTKHAEKIKPLKIMSTLRSYLNGRQLNETQRPAWNYIKDYAAKKYGVEVPEFEAVRVFSGAHNAATSPSNEIPQPTKAQKEAGNYKKGHVSIHGLDISIENPAGSERSGTDKSGKAWSIPMQDHYGYIKGTVGKDKDHLDVFVNPARPESDTVFVVDQVDQETGKLDEHKILFGFDTEEEARAGYLRNYEPGWKGLGTITGMSVEQFKGWAKSGKTTQPMAALARAADLTPDPQHAAEGMDNPDNALDFFEAAIPQPGRATMADVFAHIRKNGLHRQTSFAQQLFNMVGGMYEGRTGKKLAILGGNADNIAKEARHELNTERRDEEGTSSPQRDGAEGPGAGTRSGVSGDDRQAGAGPAGTERPAVTTPDASDASAPSGVSSTPPAVSTQAAEPVSATAPASSPITIEPHGSGIIVKGDRAQVRAKLADAGVKPKGLPNAKLGGLVFSEKQAVEVRAALEAPAVEVEFVDPQEDAVVGKNAAGEQLYDRSDGSRYRMRFDRKDNPNGYPDFGGDLAPEKQKETTNAQTDKTDLATPVTETGEVTPAVAGGNESAEGGVPDAAAGGVKEPVFPSGAKSLADVEKMLSGGRLYGTIMLDSEGYYRWTPHGLRPGQSARNLFKNKPSEFVWLGAPGWYDTDAIQRVSVKLQAAIGKENLPANRYDFTSLHGIKPTPQGAIKAPPSQPGVTSRFKPYEAVDFGGRIVGPTGAKLTSYQWQYRLESDLDNMGEEVSRRRSDWDRAEVNPETGRLIVHQFTVETPDGESHLASLETALEFLGYTASSEGGKAVGSLASILKTRARNMMELDTLTQEAAAANQWQKDFEVALKKVDVSQMPEMTVEDDGHRIAFTRGNSASLYFGPVVRRWLADPKRMAEMRASTAKLWKDDKAGDVIGEVPGGKAIGRQEKIDNLKRRIKTADAKIKAFEQSAAQETTPAVKPASEMTASELLRAAADKIDAADKPATDTLEAATDKPAEGEDATAKTKEADKSEKLYSKTDEKNLYVAHNLSTENLRHSLDLGGLGAPSLAVGNIDTSAFTAFGEITLLADPSLLFSPKTKTFDADVYSPRHPQAVHVIDRGKLDKLVSSFGDTHGLETPGEGDLEESRGLDRLQHNDAFKLAWLKDQGINIPLKKKVVPPAVRKIAGMQGGRYELEQNPDVAKIAQANAEKDLTKIPGRVREEVRGSWFDEEGELKRRYVSNLVSQAVYFRDTGGVDQLALRQAISKKFRDSKLSARFKDHARTTFDSLVKERKIFKGFTNSGNRRYSPYTLDNIVKDMTRDLRGGEGFNYGAGSVRSAFAKQFKSIAEIQKHRDRVVSKEEMDKIKEESQQKLSDLLDDLRPFYKYDSGSFGYMDDASQAIAEGYRGVRDAFKDLPAEMSAKINDFTAYLKNLPTEYFEAKMQRAVNISEFNGAVVPKGTPDDLVQALKEKGLAVRFYKKGDEADRLKAVKNTATLFSKTTTKTGTTVAQVETELRTFLKRGYDKLTGSGKLRVVQSVAELPGGENLRTQDGTIAGSFDPSTGIVYLVADNVKPGQAEYVMLHEGLHKLMREDALFSKQHDAILDRLEELKATDYRVQDAFRRVPEDTPAHLVREEALAYFIENKANHETSLFKKLIANIRMWLMRMGIPMKNLTTDDLVAMVVQGVRRLANQADVVADERMVGELAPALYSKEQIIEAAKAIYSKLEQVARINFLGMKAQGVANFLTKQGVKKAEMEAVGLNEWLAAKKPTDKVTQAELVDFVKANTVELEDVVFGETDTSDVEAWWNDEGGANEEQPFEELTADERQQAAERYQDEVGDFSETTTFFDQYTEPGAVEGSYREMFVTAPKESKEELQRKLQAGEISHKEFDDKAYKNPNWQDGHSQYSEVKNPIVRIRFNEVNADGKRLLRIEEMQGPNPDNQTKMPKHLKDNIYQLGVKRILAYAKENGFDGVALATKPGMSAGETQVDRYSLAKQVSEISYTSEGFVVAKDLSGNVIINKMTDDAELPSIVGKEVARKLITGEGATKEKWGGRQGDTANTVSGEGLKVGGEGLKTLYDTTLPAMLEAYGKGKMEEIVASPGHETDNYPWKLRDVTDDGDGGIEAEFSTKKEAEIWADENGGVRLSYEIGGSVTMPYLPLTNAPASYPMFSKAASLEDLEEVAKTMGSITVKKRAKVDSTFLDRFFSTPEYYFKKFAAAGRVLQAALLRRDVRFVKEQQILGSATVQRERIDGKAVYTATIMVGGDRAVRKSFATEEEAEKFARGSDFVKYAQWLRKENKESFEEANDYLIEVDQTGDGFSVEQEGEIWKVLDKNDKVVSRHTGEGMTLTEEEAATGKTPAEKEAVAAMIAAESALLKKNGYTKEAIQAVRLARELTNRGFDVMAADMRKIIAEAAAAGLPNPLIDDRGIDESGRYGIYAPNKKKPIALFATEQQANEAMDRAAQMISYVVQIQGGGERSFMSEIKANAWAKKHSGTVKGRKTFGGLTVRMRTDVEMRPLTVQQALAQMGDMRGTYFPRIRKPGEYVLIAKKDGENPIRKSFDLPMVGDDKNPTLQKIINMGTPMGREAMKLKAQGYDVTMGYDESPVDDVFSGTNIATAIDAILQDSMAVIDKNNQSDIKAGQQINQLITMQVADIFKARGYLSSRLKRMSGDTVWEGYETDMGKALTQYGKGVAAGTAKRDTARAMVMAFSGRDYSWEDYKQEVDTPVWADYQEIVEQRRIDPRRQKNLFTDVRAFMIDVLRNDEKTDRIIGTMKGLAVLKFLGFRVSSAAVNATNMVTGVPATMAGQVGISVGKAMSHVASAASAYGKYRIGKGDVSEADRAIFQEITDRGWDDAQFNTEAARELRSEMGEAWNKVMTASMYMFGAVEKANRATTIYAAYKAVQEQNPGMSQALIWEKAKAVSDNAHGVYGKETIPAWVRGKHNFLRLPYTFMKFSHNYMLNMIDLGYTRGEYKAAAYLLLSPAVLAGAGATVATPVILALASALGIGGDDPEEEYYKWAGKTFGTDAFARHGLAGLAGLNLKGSLQINNPMPTKLSELGGAPGAIITDTWKAIQHFGRGEMAKGAEALLPTGIGSMSKAVREGTEGITTGSYGQVYYGNEPLKSDGLDMALRFFSFNPSRISGIREKQWNEKEVAAKYQERKKEIYAKIKRLQLQGKGITPEVNKEIVRYNELVKGSGRSDIKPITPKNIRLMLKLNSRASKFERDRAVNE